MKIYCLFLISTYSRTTKPELWQDLDRGDKNTSYIYMTLVYKKFIIHRKFKKSVQIHCHFTSL
uniref:Uncharacterized protein n=1 Tax=Poecilia reticulata TaxID=8081 RepID=A0A3P9P7E2_POERE